MVRSSHMQLGQNDTNTIAEALRLGLSISIRGLNGDNIVIKTTRVYRNTKRRSLSAEYTLTQSIMPSAAYTSNDASELARMALDHAGKAAAIEAQRLITSFIAQGSKATN